MKTTALHGLVPPRPNLGPEPWSEPQSMWAASIVIVVGLVVSVVVAGFLFAILRRRRVARRAQEKRPPLDEGDITARERLIGLSGSLREALVDRFGPLYRARTIEELFTDSHLGEALGADRLELLIKFLVEVDQLKFAPERAPRDQEALQLELVDWTPRVENLKTQIRAKPAATRNHRPRMHGRRPAQRA